MRFFGYLLAILGVVGPVSAANATTSRIFVHIPFQLHNPDGFDHVQAEFGFQHSSGSISEYVYFVDEPLCSPLTFNKTQGFPAHDQGFQTPFILLTFAGTCSAVTKARHAQQIGAAALIFAGEHCRCQDQQCVDKFKDDDCIHKRPTLVNDGSGSDISIPSFLIYKSLAHELVDQLKNKNQAVLMGLLWGLKQDVGDTPDTISLRYHLWTTAYDPLLDLETLKNLKAVAKAFEDKAQFSPRFSVIDGSRFHCDKSLDENGPCDHLCTNHGRYCTVPAKNLTGHAIILETLRRLCIWRHYGENKRSEIWWDYMLYHKEHCSEPDHYGEEECLKNSLAHAKVDQHVVDECMKDAGDVDEDVSNGMLDEVIEKQKHSSVVSLPAITVNRKVLDHTSSWSLFETICREYWTSKSPTIPKVCETCSACANVMGCLEKGHCVGFSNKDRIPETGGSSTKKQSHHGWKPFWFLSFCLLGGGFLYYYKHRDEYGEGVNPFHGYMQLRGGEMRE